MRHLLLSEEWHPDIGGSIHLFDELYCQRFPPGDLVHVLAADAPGAHELDAGFLRPVTRFDARRYAWMRPESLALYTRMLLAASRIVLRDRIDVVHCGRVLPEGLVGWMLSQTLGVPYVVWVHGEDVSMYRRYWGKRNLMPEIFGNARAVLCNSSFSRERAHAAGAPSERVHVVNPCVDAPRFRGPFDTASLRARLGLEGKTVLLSVGRLTRRKGHDHVLRALARLDRRDVAYLVLSGGEMEAELHELAHELNLDGTVHFLGTVAPADLPQYFAASDVFVMANRTLPDGDVEGFGLVFLEASASGLPVVGGRSGGVVDAVQDGVTGLLVDGDSVEDIAGNLARLLDDAALRARLGANGRAWVTEKFAWERASASVRLITGSEPLHSIRPRGAARLASLGVR